MQNKLGIRDQEILNDVETILFSDAYGHFFELQKKNLFKFDSKLIFEIHKYTLGTLYEWAGSIRIVDISKDGMLFCPSSQIRKNLELFEKVLKKNLPTREDSKAYVAEKLAVVHCEFIAIHPFREGNGRTIRLFLDLLAVGSGFKSIDYTKSSPELYIDGCRAGMMQDYLKMQKVMYRGLTER